MVKRTYEATAHSETVLSNASLGIDADIRKPLRAYRRNGIRVRRMRVLEKKSKRYSEVVIPPVQGWYPSKSSSFTFGVDIDPKWIIKHLVPWRYNPAVWVKRGTDHLALRVPRDRGKETYDRLYKNHFWYHTIKRLWFLRRGRRK